MKYLCMFWMICCISINLQSANYRSYYQKISEAELYIAKSDYNSALTVYSDVFKNYPHSFYKDVHNACICAVKLDKEKEAFEFAQMLVLHGCELSWFNNEPFEYLKNKKRLWKKFAAEYPNLRNEYQRNKYRNGADAELREKYYLLYVADTIAAKHRNDNTGTAIKQQDSIFYSLSLKLVKMIEENGFPNWMTVKDDTMSMKLHVMLRHYCGLENRIRENAELRNDSLYALMSDSQIHHVVDSAFNEGLVPQDFYVSITTYWMSKHPYGEILMEIDLEKETATPAFHFMSPDKIDQINKNRQSIGLHPINPDTKDLASTTWYKDYPFKEIKKALAEAECNTWSDSLSIIADIAANLEEESKKKESHFILQPIGDF